MAKDKVFCHRATERQIESQIDRTKTRSPPPPIPFKGHIKKQNCSANDMWTLTALLLSSTSQFSPLPIFCAEVLLFCVEVLLFCVEVLLFCVEVLLFCVEVLLFCAEVLLFCVEVLSSSIQKSSKFSSSSSVQSCSEDGLPCTVKLFFSSWTKIKRVFETQMPTVATKNKLVIFSLKVTVKVIQSGVIWKGFMHMHAKYELSISYSLKVMAKVNVFTCRWKVKVTRSILFWFACIKNAIRWHSTRSKYF